MFVKVLVSFSDRLGRSYKPGDEIEYDNEEANRLLNAGYVVQIPPDAVKCVHLLQGLGAGVYARSGTDPDLLAAAQAADVPIKSTKAAPKAPDPPAGGDETPPAAEGADGAEGDGAGGDDH